ncbi:alpha/beta hydrolase [Marinomonas rhizomae]|uniref:Sigma-B regulation protein RsbQ n=1 Tax=Marinomonas rhizomae TaxID=491948 RepID=A0A366IV91_9GAMM|nr:alpha/beta hydrolase [Marinomonas rhizomae]RBP77944.1 sigma-B regulation protein RsbQ [Marinomonas rhizomae]RNF68921.1 alpha/beta hydrolase [Marinomonas rhizomae]
MPKTPQAKYKSSDVMLRNNIQLTGKGEKTIILAHGFGCNQSMWRFMLPFLEKKYQVLLFDYVGSGNSDFSAYEAKRYQHLEGYALDIIEICDAFDLKDTIFVGHSISSTIGWIVAQQRPELFSKMVAVCPSPCFLNLNDEYQGGFEKQDLEGLIQLMDKDYIGWGNYLAPIVMGNDLSPIGPGMSEGDALVHELLSSFCATDVTYSKPFAQATFFSDYRSLLPEIFHPCLILQSSNDALVAVNVGKYTQSKLQDAELEIIEGNGHCLHMTHPMHVLNSMQAFL